MGPTFKWACRQQLHEVMDQSHAESERVKAENAVEDEAWAQPPTWKAAVSLTKPWVIGANFAVDQGEVCFWLAQPNLHQRT